MSTVDKSLLLLLFLVVMVFSVHSLCIGNNIIRSNSRTRSISISRLRSTSSSTLNECIAQGQKGRAGDSPLWRSLSAPRFISAPMVEQSYLPYRYMVRKHGTQLAFSQMINAKVLLTSHTYRNEAIDWTDYSSYSGELRLAEALDRPLIAQLAGDDPETLIAAGKILLASGNISAIDLNLGCPQHIAKRGHYGAYLLPHTDLVLRILSAMVTNLPCPITAKIRKLPNDADTIALAQSIEKCGVQMLTIHGRHASQLKQFTGKVDWDIIRSIKESVSIPVVANGGIGCLADAHECLSFTGADAVMSSEGLLENPHLFSVEGDHQFRNDFVRFQLASAKELVSYFQHFRLTNLAKSSLRSHLFKMLHRFLSANANHDLRLTLSRCSFEEIALLVEELSRRLSAVDFNTYDAITNNLVQSQSWYRRHWPSNFTEVEKRIG